jgi:hypothetical protein
MTFEGTDRFVSPNGGRDTMSIIHGCVSTLVLCSWSAVHLHIPAENDTEWEVTLCRARWMLTSIIAPEYVAIHAIREWYETSWLLKEIKSVMERRQLDPVLEQNSIPGVVNIKAPPPLRLPREDKTSQDAIVEEKLYISAKERLEKLYQTNLRKASTISTVVDLTDERSESVTSYGGITLVPSGVQSPRRSSTPVQYWTAEHAYFVYMGGFDLLLEDAPPFRLNGLQFLALLREGLIDLPEISSKEIRAQSKLDIFAKAWACVQMFWLIAYLVTRAAERLPVTTLELFTAGEVCCTVMMYIGWWKKPKDVAVTCKIQLSMKWNDIRSLLESEIIESRRNYSHVGISDHFYRCRTNMKQFTWMLALPTFVFGTCHLLGWQQYFPTQVEKILWHTSSISCLVLPLVIVAFGDVSRRLKLEKCDNGIVVLLLLYVIFRMYMCAEMFAGLREVPLGVYDDKQWTRYIPHIGS